MSRATRIVRSVFMLFMPVVVLLIAGFVGASVWFVHSTAVPPHAQYLVTPEKYGRLSSRGAQVTDERWQNRDGTEARGWLLKGTPGYPAVILLHRYGADRSHVLNLGVKLNEATDYTVLMPDQRGHGPSPLIAKTTFGGCESEDVLAAIDYIKGLKTASKKPLIANSIGIYGVEMGGLAGLSASSKFTSVKAIALDSVPMSSDDVLALAVDEKFPFASSITSELAKSGAYLYYANGCYERRTVCDMAQATEGREVLLLAGADRPALRNSTSQLSGCFARTSKVTTFTDMNPSGLSLASAPLEQADAYEQRVIYFFKSILDEKENIDSDSSPKEDANTAK
ncbi:MAG: hypothetical protein R2684_11615 [Pyrinomonadaceae bacterium]